MHGLVIFSKRSAAISAWLTGIDLVFVKASLETREVLLEVGLDTQHAQHRRHAPPPQPQPPPATGRDPPRARARSRTPRRPVAADLLPSRGRGGGGGGGKGLEGRGPWGLRGRPAGLGWAALPAWSPPPPPARPPLTRRYPLRLGRYLLARIKDPQQKLEAQLFEEGKETTNGLHFLSIQSGPEADAPDGFWLLKDFETVGRS